MYKALLCVRYLRTRYIALASIVSVMLGVATMIVVNSVMAGFSTEMRDRLHGILADVIVETHSLDGQWDAEKQMALAREAAGDSIEAMAATVEVYGMIHFDYLGTPYTQTVTLIGIRPEEKAKLGKLVEYLDSYNPDRVGRSGARGPLRSADELPSWELTEEALAYRKSWVDQQQLLRQRYQDIESENGGDFHPFTEPADAQTQPDVTATDADADHALPAGDSESTSLADTGDLPSEPEPDLGGIQDLVDDPVEGEEIDPLAPLSGRLYVGLRLVSFPGTVSETGESKLVMMVRPGDDVKLTTFTAGRPPDPVHFHATIVDLFQSGMSEYDSNLVFCNLEELQRVRGMVAPDGGRKFTSIQIKIKDTANAADVVKRLSAVFPPELYSVRTWEERQGTLLAAVEVEAAILNVLLFLIVAVAGFGILAIFFMIVVEKTRDIGVLKALGASSGGVMSIFVSYGFALGIVGSSVGVVTGLLFVEYINKIEKWMTWLTGRKVFDQAVYYFPEIPTAVHAGMVFWVASGAVAIAVLASILPARRAARLNPVEALRYE